MRIKDKISSLETHIRETDREAELDKRLLDMRAQVETAKARAEAASAQARDAETLRMEKDRLSEDNALVEGRLAQMEEAMLADKAVLGHGNSRQKIQYHTRMKQELEELRHECTVLLRERFHLEQCIRCADYVITCLSSLLRGPSLLPSSSTRPLPPSLLAFRSSPSPSLLQPWRLPSLSAQVPVSAAPYAYPFRYLSVRSSVGTEAEQCRSTKLAGGRPATTDKASHSAAAAAAADVPRVLHVVLLLFSVFFFFFFFGGGGGEERGRVLSGVDQDGRESLGPSSFHLPYTSILPAPVCFQFCDVCVCVCVCVCATIPDLSSDGGKHPPSVMREGCDWVDQEERKTGVERLSVASTILLPACRSVDLHQLQLS